jgi:hypothetical protein
MGHLTDLLVQKYLGFSNSVTNFNNHNFLLIKISLKLSLLSKSLEPTLIKTSTASIIEIRARISSKKE